jgi:hypothetical protein
MKQKIIGYYLASLVAIFTSGLTAANISKNQIAAESIATHNDTAPIASLFP